MKKLIYLFIVFTTLSIAIVISCREESNQKDVEPLTKDIITPERLWERITEETNYEKYKNWPNHKGLRRGQAPHGAFHEIFINDILYNSLPNKDKIAPYGSIIVKNNYSQEKEFGAVTIMAKIKDYDPEHNDWYWMKYSEDGKVLAKGKEGQEGIIEPCINCHRGKVENDYIIVKLLDEKK